MNIKQAVVAASRQARKPKKDQRLDDIYRTAADIIHRQGFDATTLNDIGKAVGLTKAGLYHYLPSKERLLFGIMNYAMDRVQADVIVPAQAEADPVERMRTIIRQYAHLIIDDGQAITLIINEVTGLARAHQRQVTQRRRAFYEFVRDTIQQIKDEGQAPVLDGTVTALSVFGVMMWLAHWYSADGRLTREQVVDEITELTVGRMLGVRRAAKHKTKTSTTEKS